ncbi:hypothetical protein LIER_12023 [Lithospermum erythrorhizon]|uniref:Uncharacterized protein n=1 Tax=Lithospermum erythrorhizon TaxID=34254 RepID=A0AAV3PRH1_LITER
MRRSQEEGDGADDRVEVFTKGGLNENQNFISSGETDNQSSDGGRQMKDGINTYTERVELYNQPLLVLLEE